MRVGGSAVGNRGHDVSRVRVGYRRGTVGVTRWSNEHARRGVVFSPVSTPLLRPVSSIPRTTSPTTKRTCHRQRRCASAKEGVSCESGRGLGNERATRAGMASGVRASGTSTSTVRTSKTIRCCGKSSNRDFEFLTLCFVSWRTR